jgi:aminoglycoside phosphotransferase (APT) family kinase protein
MMRIPPSLLAARELAESLLARAALGPIVDIQPAAMHSNAHCVVEVGGGGRSMLRWFKENAPPHTALARLDRECWVNGQLALAGAPVPRLLAWSRERGAEAMLTTLVDGEHLGAIVPSLRPRAAAQAWSSCGSALAAVHPIDARRAAAAGCERVGIKHPTASRGLWHHEQALISLEQLAIVRSDLGPLTELVGAVTDAQPLYEQAPLVLCQFDAHLWQFLVARDEQDQWRCAALLDWEHSDLDDPDWDLAQLDGFRWGKLDVVPHAFFAGYGRVPSSSLYALYRLERAAWILSRAAAEATDWLALSVPIAERFITALLARPKALRERIDAAASSAQLSSAAGRRARLRAATLGCARRGGRRSGGR